MRSRKPEGGPTLCFLCPTLARNLVFPRRFAPGPARCAKAPTQRVTPRLKDSWTGANGGNRGSPLSLLPPVLCTLVAAAPRCYVRFKKVFAVFAIFCEEGAKRWPDLSLGC